MADTFPTMMFQFVAFALFQLESALLSTNTVAVALNVGVASPLLM